MNEQDEILVVDDAPITLDLLTHILSTEGFQVRSANNGELALNLIAAKPPQLILLDINMPEMDGFEVCRRLKAKEESEGIPVIFISGLTNLEEKVIGFGLGAVDFISKPFQREELLARIRTHLELNRLRTKLEAQVMIQTAELRKSKEEILRERDFSNEMLTSLPGIFYLFDQTGKFLRWNKNFEQVTRYSPEEITGMHPLDLFVGPDRALIQETIQKVFSAGFSDAEADLIAKSREGIPCYFTGRKIQIEGKPCLLGMGIDITVRRRTEEVLRESEERFRLLVENAPYGIFIRTQGQFAYINKTALRLFGGTFPDQLLGQPVMDRIHPDYHEVVHERIRLLNEERKDVPPLEQKYLKLDGTSFDVEVSAVPFLYENQKGALIFFHDITYRKRAEEAFKTLSLKDDLTGLYNRRGFFVLAEQGLKTAQRMGTRMFLIFGDLDNLKGINDTLGHKEGDQALLDTSEILKETFRESDIIARIGGDEFVILAMNSFEISAEKLIDRFEKVLNARHLQTERSYKLSMSFGIAYFDPQNPCSIDVLMAQADKLMYENKSKRGRTGLELLA
ncbi:MAG: PAS domain S-box protein [Thermodesulfobacteriota bacterium]